MFGEGGEERNGEDKERGVAGPGYEAVVFGTGGIRVLNMSWCCILNLFIYFVPFY